MEAPKKQQQVSKKSGSNFHVNIDSISFACLSACQGILHNHGNDYSNNVIIRRALRCYLDKLQRLSPLSQRTELVELQRAAKGIA